LEDPAEAKKIVEEIDSVRIAEHEHSEESESHCVETHVDDVIEFDSKVVSLVET
jgi:hypothetical protein